MKRKIIYTLFYLYTIFYILFPASVSAQDAISLSISPPIFEIMIQPGKEYKTHFTISNQGGFTNLTPKIVVFTPSDDFGNVNLTNKPAPDWIKYDPQPNSLGSGKSSNFSVLFSPLENTPEIDYYLSLVFETDSPTDLLIDNSSLYTAKIASNILITVSKDGNPQKSAEIVEFSAPKIVDSLFGNIEYKIIIKNSGHAYWKPNGKIIINNKEILNLAPQNIISGYSRNITCINNENLIPCKLEKKPFAGIVNATLEFSVDENPQIYRQEISTFVFPFSLVVVTIVFTSVFLLTKRIRKVHS